MSDPFDELVARVRAVTGLTGRAASATAIVLSDEYDRAPSAPEIVACARELGFQVEDSRIAQAERDEATAEWETDPAEVLKQVYRACPRMLPRQEGHDQVYVPRVGKAPKDSAFFNEEIQAAIAELPDEIRLLLVGVDLLNGAATITLYDEANDVDRHVGPIDLAPYGSEKALNLAIVELLKRLPRVIASDWN
jgi:hypothetical protein